MGLYRNSPSRAANAVYFRFVPALLGALGLGKRIVQAPEPGIGLASTRFGFSQGRFLRRQEPKKALLPLDADPCLHFGEACLALATGPIYPAPKKCCVACPEGWEIVSRHDIGQRLAVGRDCFRVAANKSQQRRDCQYNTHRRSMRCRLGFFGATPKAVATYSQALADIVSRYDLPASWAGLAVFFQGWARWLRGEREAGLAEMRRGSGISREQGLVGF